MNIIIDNSAAEYINDCKEYILKSENGRIGAVKKLQGQDQTTDAITHIFEEIIGAAHVEDSANLREKLICKIDPYLKKSWTPAEFCRLVQEKKIASKSIIMLRLKDWGVCVGQLKTISEDAVECIPFHLTSMGASTTALQKVKRDAVQSLVVLEQATEEKNELSEETRERAVLEQVVHYLDAEAHGTMELPSSFAQQINEYSRYTTKKNLDCVLADGKTLCGVISDLARRQGYTPYQLSEVVDYAKNSCAIDCFDVATRQRLIRWFIQSNALCDQQLISALLGNESLDIEKAEGEALETAICCKLYFACTLAPLAREALFGSLFSKVNNNKMLSELLVTYVTTDPNDFLGISFTKEKKAEILRKFFEEACPEKRERFGFMCKFGLEPIVLQLIMEEINADNCNTLDKDGHSPLYNFFRSHANSRFLLCLSQEDCTPLLQKFHELHATLQVKEGKEYEAIFPYLCRYYNEPSVPPMVERIMQTGCRLDVAGVDGVTGLGAIQESLKNDLPKLKDFFEKIFPKFYEKKAFYVVAGQMLVMTLSRMKSDEAQEYAHLMKEVLEKYPELLRVEGVDLLEILLREEAMCVRREIFSDLFLFFVAKGVPTTWSAARLQKVREMRAWALIPCVIDHLDQIPEDLDFVNPHSGLDKNILEQIVEAVLRKKTDLQKDPKLARSFFGKFMQIDFTTAKKEALIRKFFDVIAPEAKYRLHAMCQYSGYFAVRDMIVAEADAASCSLLDKEGHGVLYNFLRSLEGDVNVLPAQAIEYVLEALGKKGAKLVVEKGKERDFGIIFPILCAFEQCRGVPEMITQILATDCSLSETIWEGGPTGLFYLVDRRLNSREDLRTFVDTIYPKFAAKRAFYVAPREKKTVLHYLFEKLIEQIFDPGYVEIVKKLVDLAPAILNIEHVELNGSVTDVLRALIDESTTENTVPQAHALLTYFLNKGAKILHTVGLIEAADAVNAEDIILLLLEKKAPLPPGELWDSGFLDDVQQHDELLRLLINYRTTERIRDIPMKEIRMLLKSDDLSSEKRKAFTAEFTNLSSEELDLLPWNESLHEIQKALRSNIAEFQKSFGREKLAYLACLFQDMDLASGLAREIASSQFTVACESLAKKMPHWNLEIQNLIHDTVWKVAPRHLQMEVPALPEKEPNGVKLEDILTLFDRLSDADIQLIAKATRLDGEMNPRAALRARLDDDIFRIINKRRREIPGHELPQDTLPEQKELFYQEIRLARLWTIQKLQEKNDPELVREVIGEYAVASPFCGAPFLQVSLEQFQRLVTGRRAGPESTIVSALADLRDQCMMHVATEIAKDADIREPDTYQPNYYETQSVHFYNGMMQKVGKALQVPLADTFAVLGDPYPYFEHHYMNYHSDWKQDAFARFYKEYTPSAIIETVISRLDDEPFEPLFDYVKSQIRDNVLKVRDVRRAQNYVTSWKYKKALHVLKESSAELVAKLAKRNVYIQLSKEDLEPVKTASAFRQLVKYKITASAREEALQDHLEQIIERVQVLASDKERQRFTAKGILPVLETLGVIESR